MGLAMWFDARAKLAEIAGQPPEAQIPALRVASVASVATPPRPKSQPTRADGLGSDAGAYLDRLRLHGPATSGAMATALGWGATQAWQAEAKLRALGLVVYCEGKAKPTERGRK